MFLFWFTPLKFIFINDDPRSEEPRSDRTFSALRPCFRTMIAVHSDRGPIGPRSRSNTVQINLDVFVCWMLIQLIWTFRFTVSTVDRTAVFGCTVVNRWPSIIFMDKLCENGLKISNWGRERNFF